MPCMWTVTEGSAVASWCVQAIVKALEELTRDQKIKEKVYGKQKVYVADQVSFSKSYNFILQEVPVLNYTLCW